MTNKGKIKYFTLGLLVATLWFLVIGGICLLISSGVIGGKKDTGDGGAVTEANIEKIEHFQRLLETYYYEDVPKEDLADGVLYGLMETVGDPYTCYYSVEEMEELTADIEGIFHGVGDTMSTFVYGTVGMWGVRILGTYIFVILLGRGLIAAWACMIAHNLVLSLLLSIRYIRGKWNPLARASQAA